MQKNNKNKFYILIATGFYIGFVPKAPGTAGALLGIVLGVILNLLPFFWALLLISIAFILGCYASNVAQEYFNSEDPQKVVIDEVVGMAIALMFLPMNLKIILMQFILFRLFDIFKPFPVKQMEEIFDGGLSIMMDDVMAGILSNVLFRIGSIFLT